MKKEYEFFLKKSTILLVEDEISVAQSFKKVLLLYVKEVYIASDGEKAYEAYERVHPDIIITDIKIPKLNGLNLIKKIRKNNKKIPIVVTSAYANQEFLLESIKLFLVEYLIKPIKESDLTRVLQECAKVLSSDQTGIVKVSKISFYDYDNKEFIYNDKKIPLTKKEAMLFELLLLHRRNLVSRKSIENKLYIYKEASPSALKNLIFKLRKKLQIDIIKTVGKLGYMIDI